MCLKDVSLKFKLDSLRSFRMVEEKHEGGGGGAGKLKFLTERCNPLSASVQCTNTLDTFNNAKKIDNSLSN